MRALFVIILLAALVLPSGHASGSPPRDLSAADLQTQAAQGDANAQNNLGVLYFEGQGGPQNYAKARQWFEKAVTQGHARAQYNLGTLYHNGQGVPQDYVRAYMWYNLAVPYLTGDVQMLAAGNRDEVVRRMTPAQVAEAQRLSQQCQAQHFMGC